MIIVLQVSNYWIFRGILKSFFVEASIYGVVSVSNRAKGGQAVTNG